MIPVFVYGTLRKGQGNSHYLAQSHQIGGIRKLSGYEMYEVCPSFPGITEGDGKVYGELYHVDNRTLYMLDMLEGVPHFYDRKEVVLDCGTHAYAYVLPDDLKENIPVKCGDWVQYKKK